MRIARSRKLFPGDHWSRPKRKFRGLHFSLRLQGSSRLRSHLIDIKDITKDIDKGLLPILIAVAVMAFGMSFVLPLIPLVIHDLGASPSTIGQITSFFFISFTLVTLPIGKWIEKFGPKRLIMLGLFVYGASIFSMIFPTKAGWFYLIRIAQGFGSACLFVPTESAINVLSSPERRGANMGLYAMVFALGMAFGPPLGTWLFEINRVITMRIRTIPCALPYASSFFHTGCCPTTCPWERWYAGMAKRILT